MKRSIDRTKPWYRRSVSWRRAIFALVMAFWAQGIINSHFQVHAGLYSPGQFAGLITLVFLIWLGVEVD